MYGLRTVKISDMKGSDELVGQIKESLAFQKIWMKENEKFRSQYPVDRHIS